MSEPLPHPENPGSTHYEGCYRERGHHNCAVMEIERLREERRSLAYAVLFSATGDALERTMPLAARVLAEYGPC